MYDKQITLFNFHEKTGTWRTTGFSGVDVITEENTGHTAQSGEVNGDNVALIIHVKRDQGADSIVYEPFRILNSDGDFVVAEEGSYLGYQEPDTGRLKHYIGPKAYARLDDPLNYFTFKPETDFFAMGNFCQSEPIDDDDFDEGLYHEMNEGYDGVYLISSVAYYGLLPHFEIGGR